MALKLWLMLVLMMTFSSVVSVEGQTSHQAVNDASLDVDDFMQAVRDQIPIPFANTYRAIKDHGPSTLLTWYDPIYDDLGPAWIEDGITFGELAAIFSGSEGGKLFANGADFIENMWDKNGGYDPDKLQEIEEVYNDKSRK